MLEQSLDYRRSLKTTLIANYVIFFKKSMGQLCPFWNIFSPIQRAKDPAAVPNRNAVSSVLRCIVF